MCCEDGMVFRTKRIREASTQSSDIVKPLKQVLSIKCDTYVYKLCRSLVVQLFCVWLLKSPSLPRRLRG